MPLTVTATPVVEKVATRAVRLVPAGTVTATVWADSLTTPTEAGLVALKLKAVSALALLRGTTRKARGVLQGPARPERPPRTFQVSSTPAGRARLLVQLSVRMPRCESSSSPPS